MLLASLPVTGRGILIHEKIFFNVVFEKNESFEKSRRIRAQTIRFKCKHLVKGIHHFYITFTSLLHRFYIGLTSLLHHSYINSAPHSMEIVKRRMSKKIVEMLPQIEAALSAGASYKEVLEWLRTMEIDVHPRNFEIILYRVRKRAKKNIQGSTPAKSEPYPVQQQPSTHQPPQPPKTLVTPASGAVASQPTAQQNRPKRIQDAPDKFTYDPNKPIKW